MLEKIQEKFYKKIREGLLDQTSVEIPFKYFLMERFPNQQVPDKDFTRALLDFDKKYNLDHVIILGGKGAVAIRFWWQKGRIMEITGGN
jgi:hypothetical protein